MILDTLALFDDKSAAATYLSVTSALNWSASAYDSIAAAGGTGNTATGVNTSTTAGSGGAGAGSQPAPLNFGGAVGAPIMHDIGRGKPVFLIMQVNTTLTSAGAMSVTPSLVGNTQADLTGGSQVTLLTGPTVAKASLVGGYRFPFKTLPGKIPSATCQFIGMQYLVATTAANGGTFTSGLMIGLEDHADILG